MSAMFLMVSMTRHDPCQDVQNSNSLLTKGPFCADFAVFSTGLQDWNLNGLSFFPLDACKQCFPESTRQLFWSDDAFFENCRELDQGSLPNELHNQWWARKWFRSYIHPQAEGPLVATAAIPTGLLNWRLHGRFSLDACAQISSEPLTPFIFWSDAPCFRHREPVQTILNGRYKQWRIHRWIWKFPVGKRRGRRRMSNEQRNFHVLFSGLRHAFHGLIFLAAFLFPSYTLVSDSVFVTGIHNSGHRLRRHHPALCDHCKTWERPLHDDVRAQGKTFSGNPTLANHCTRPGPNSGKRTVSACRLFFFIIVILQAQLSSGVRVPDPAGEGGSGCMCSLAERCREASRSTRTATASTSAY